MPQNTPESPPLNGSENQNKSVDLNLTEMLWHEWLHPKLH